MSDSAAPTAEPDAPDVLMKDSDTSEDKDDELEEEKEGSMSQVAGGDGELIGRVMRLHFRCRAELPIGSFLRVTGSSLWAPGTPSADPADAAVSVERTEASAFVTTLDDVESDNVHSRRLSQSLYTSSVEMVTTPEEYPIWRTRKPVVIVLPNRRRTVYHHYYRYLVVSPGCGKMRPYDPMNEDEVDFGTQVMVSTSDEKLGSTSVLQWEDPFSSRVDPIKHQNSALSLASSVAPPQNTKADYRNLPYRTIDITSVPSMLNSSSSEAMDQYGNPDDSTFQPYLIREAVRKDILHQRLSGLPIE